MREIRVRFLGWEDPLEKEMAVHSSTLAWKIHGQRSLIGYSPWGRKESDTTERLLHLAGTKCTSCGWKCGMGIWYDVSCERGGPYRRPPSCLVRTLSLFQVWWEASNMIWLISACNAGDPSSVPGLGRSPGEGNGSPLQHSCLENPMDGGAWWAAVHGIAELDTAERLHFHFLSLSSVEDISIKQAQNFFSYHLKRINSSSERC